MIKMGFNSHMDTPTLNSDSIVLDFGANRGEYIDKILNEYNCKVIAYEPTSWMFENLKGYYGKGGSKTHYKHEVELNQTAIWSKNTTKEFYDYGSSVSDGRANSLGYTPELVRQTESINGNLYEYFKKEKVICKSFDSVLDRFDRVDICKIDVEGAEIEILSKASDESLLKCNQICGEFHPVDSQRMQGGLKSITKKDVYGVIDRLDKLGFKHVITEYELHSETGKSTDCPKYIIFYQEELI